MARSHLWTQDTDAALEGASRQSLQREIEDRGGRIRSVDAKARPGRSTARQGPRAADDDWLPAARPRKAARTFARSGR